MNVDNAIEIGLTLSYESNPIYCFIATDIALQLLAYEAAERVTATLCAA